MSTATLPAFRPRLVEPEPAPSRTSRIFSSARLWLPLILLVQAGLALRPGYNETAFDDEGLYVFMGHRMIDHFLNGSEVFESPGSYFSGAPGLYPVLAAMADSVGGLPAARGLSLFFAMLATLGTYGLGQRLFGRGAGLLGAFSLVLCGSIIFQSHLATFDSMTLALVALGAWLAVYSAQEDGLLWAPAIAAVLATGALAKYAGAVYIPMVAALAVTAGWRKYHWQVVRRAIFMVVASVVMFLFVIQIWAQDLLHGIIQTTSDRDVIRPAGTELLLRQVVEWIGPWLGLAVLGAVLVYATTRRWATPLVLLAASVVGPLQQVRIGEAVSLSKHVGFGLVFAAPLIGYLCWWMVRKLRWFSLVPLGAIFGTFAVSGLFFSQQFLTGWVDDRPLRPALLRSLETNPGAPILGEQPSAMRYALRKEVAPKQWNDTYAFTFGGLEGPEAYRAAIRAHYFQVIYLGLTTDNGPVILDELIAADRDRYYHIVDKVPRTLRGEKVGEWLVFAPRSVETSPGVNK